VIWLRSFASLAALLVLWQAATAAFALPSYVLPSPLESFQELAQSLPMLAPHLAYSLISLGLGLVCGILLSIAIAAVMQMLPSMQDAAMPLIIGLRVIPFVAIAPLIALIVGRDMRTSIVVVTISSVFPLLLGIITGLAQTPREMIELFYVHAATRWQIVTRLRVPIAIPYFFAGLRVALPTALLAVLIAEWLTGSRGLGFLILDAADTMRAGLLWGLVTLTTAVSLFLFCIVRSIETLLSRHGLRGDAA
jgi:ABC-type nitrate/sulfonate/bicarbonate transport system permease component